MNNSAISRRNVLSQIGFSLAGIVGLSSANNLFAFTPSEHISVRVRVEAYNRAGRRVPTADGVAPLANVAIACPSRRIYLTGKTGTSGELYGKVYFDLNRYYSNYKGTDTWNITATYRGVSGYKTTTISRGKRSDLLIKIKLIV